jgi:CRISPR-associated endonuclease/helicase Cas3
VEYYAHTPSPGTDKWHLLTEHSRDVATRAKGSVERFGAGELAFTLGILHDLGKINENFQEYLQAQYRGQPHASTPHAIWGAAFTYWFVCKRLGIAETWKDLSLPIAAHHSKLADGGTIGTKVAEWAEKNEDAINKMRQFVLTLPSFSLPVHEPDQWKREVRLRMAFSALVDADCLDTERHFDSAQAEARQRYSTIESLRDIFESKQRDWMEKIPSSRLNDIRHEAYTACRAQATGPKGVYRLTVPTGGGKTRSVLAFALNHAVEHEMRRVIVAVPYTSIIEQTVDVYRGIFGHEAVLEHHSQIDLPENEREDERAARFRLSTQNWDAPLIVTTTVQLLESLFSNRSGRVRKLHNIANSIIILDEVQTLPLELLEPTVQMLRALVDDYGATVILSTATQPALEDTTYLKPFHGVEVHEIVPEHPTHFADLKRVHYSHSKDMTSWEEIAQRVAVQPRIMVVLNTRADALALARALPETDTFHLSTLLCGAHRRKVLSAVKNRLEMQRNVRLISTQVIEAGVDIDFPHVWRAMGPLDRIAQAAGRCNREARPELGEVVIFETREGNAPRGAYRVGIEEAREILAQYGPDALHAPDIYRKYFARLFAQVDLDARGIQSARFALDFPTVAEKYRLIEATDTVAVPYEDGLVHLDAWERYPSRKAWQRLQPYLVSIHRHETKRLVEERWLSAVTDGLYRWNGDYHGTLGLAQIFLDPTDLIG